MTPNNTTNSLTPSQIVKELDKYIIGQVEAKKKLGIAIRNRWRRQQIKDPIMRKEVKGDNMLMIGSTGTGKTECARRVANMYKSPFVKVEATNYTTRGYVGGDVNNIITKLVNTSMNILKEEHVEKVKEKAIESVYEAILDKLIPPLTSERNDLEGTSSSQEVHLNAETRASFMEQIKKGLLDHREIEIEIEQESSTGIGFSGNGMVDEATMMNVQNMLKKMLPRNVKKRKVSIKVAKEILLEQEKNKLIDHEAIKEEALQRAAENGIVFIDEIDKIVSSASHREGAEVNTQGVQRDLLPLIEGCIVDTPYGTIHTEHVLFITAGAFHISKPSDLIPELQGRLPIRVQLDALTEQNFYDILQHTENSMIKRSQALFLTEGVVLNFEDEAIKEIASQAFKINQNIENIGARRLHTVMNHLLDDFLFNMPEKIGEDKNITITKEFVIERLSKVVKEKELSQYIL